MGKAFNLADFMPDANVSKLDTPTREIKMIPTRSVFPNDKNFYDTSNVSDLIDSILLHGLLDPLTVRPAGDGESYIIISGHRRHKAMMTILDDALAEDLTPFEAVPCFIAEPRDELMEELMLIQANSATRVLTPAELTKQAEKIEELLYQLKEQGYEFPGRMRDHVAKACNVAASRLGRLKVIREKLIPELYERFETGKMPENAAYAAARCDECVQRILIRRYDGRRYDTMITILLVEFAQTAINRIDALPTHCGNGSVCTQREDRIEAYIQKGSAPCGGKCCLDCASLRYCTVPCESAVEKQKRLQDEFERSKAEEKAASEQRTADCAEVETERNVETSSAGRWHSVAAGDLPGEGQAVIVLNRFTQGAAWSCNTSVYHNDAFRFTQDLDMELCGVQYWLPSPELPE